MLSKILSSVGVPWLHPSHLNQHRKSDEGGEGHVEAFRNVPIQVVRWKMFYLYMSENAYHRQYQMLQVNSQKIQSRLSVMWI